MTPAEITQLAETATAQIILQIMQDAPWFSYHDPEHHVLFSGSEIIRTPAYRCWTDNVTGICHKEKREKCAGFWRDSLYRNPETYSEFNPNRHEKTQHRTRYALLIEAPKTKKIRATLGFNKASALKPRLIKALTALVA